MAQSDFGDLIATDPTGVELGQALNLFRDAQNSAHGGAARPAYAVAGMTWVDTSAAKWRIMFYDGASDVQLAEVDPATHEKTPEASGVPTGTVAWFAANTPPTGFLVADGSAISRTAYSDLFAAIGSAFGVGDGSTTFNLPDLRGEFIRGWDNGRGVDVGRAFGSWQDHEIEAHTHTYNEAIYGGVGNGGFDGAIDNLSTTGATGGDETRPRNVALLPMIKF